MAARVLIVYESKNGQTHKISEFIGNRLKQQGHQADLINVAYQIPVDLSKYDGVIVGAPIYMRGYPRGIQKWVSQHSEVLNRKHSAFFSVGMQVLMTDEPSQRDLLLVSDQFFNKTAWYPKRRKVFAGGVCFSHYNFFTRYIMRYFSKKAGHELDMHQDYEFTNWSDVSRFSDEFVESLRPRHEEYEFSV